MEVNKLYIQASSAYNFQIIGAELPTQETKNVFSVSREELQEIGITKKFDLQAQTLVPMTQEQITRRTNKERIANLRNRLAAQDWIHVRHLRETGVLATKKAVCTVPGGVCQTCAQACVLSGSVIEKLSMPQDEYMRLSVDQGHWVKEINELEAANEELLKV